jgi:hypothetical protein
MNRPSSPFPHSLFRLMLFAGLLMLTACSASRQPQPTPSPAPPCMEDRLIVADLSLPLIALPENSPSLDQLPAEPAAAYRLDLPAGGLAVVLPPAPVYRASLTALTAGQTVVLARADCTLTVFAVTSAAATDALPGAELAARPGELNLWTGGTQPGEGGWLVRAVLLATPPPAVAEPPPAALPTLAPDETLVVIPTPQVPPEFQAELSLLEAGVGADGTSVEITLEIRNYGPNPARLSADSLAMRDAAGRTVTLRTSQPALPADLPVGQAVTLRLSFDHPAALPAVLTVLETEFDIEIP